MLFNYKDLGWTTLSAPLLNFGCSGMQCQETSPLGRLSLAQHGAAGGVLGKAGSQPDPRRGGTGSHTNS